MRGRKSCSPRTCHTIHAVRGANGFQHPAQLGPQLAKKFADEIGCPAFVVNPPDTDEIQPVARMTGIKGVYRNVHLHALNLKDTAIQHAAALGRKYEDCNFVVCHIGGGISISAHQKGRMIDGNDNVGGEGPMAPTRCGAVPAAELINYCFSGVDKKTAKTLCTKTGGFVSLLGGGMVHNKELVTKITEACSFIAPVAAYPGEFEMEAMAAGAIRALTGEEQIKTYTGKLCWDRADFED